LRAFGQPAAEVRATGTVLAVLIGMKLRFSVALLLVAVIPAARAGAITLGPELVVNGSFEEPNVQTGTWSIFASIPGWTAFAIDPDGDPMGLEIQDNWNGPAFDGAQHAELDANFNNGMFQDVPTVAGLLYQLQFAYSPRPGVPETTNAIGVYWDGMFVGSFTGAGGGNTLWTVYTFSYVATGPTQIEFRALGTSDQWGGYVDAVSTRQVVESTRQVDESLPEPGTLMLLGAGLAALGIKTSRRRR
jgi:PEP-CTERM motif